LRRYLVTEEELFSGDIPVSSAADTTWVIGNTSSLVPEHPGMAGRKIQEIIASLA
jgi:hypothetical protein